MAKLKGNKLDSMKITQEWGLAIELLDVF
jgi:hypothetical protein